MRALVAAALAASALAGQALAVDPPSCAVPDNLLFVDNTLSRVTAAVSKEHKLAIAVLGTGSSMLAGATGPGLAYPRGREAGLNQRLSKVAVKAATRPKNAEPPDVLRRNRRGRLGAEK